ncbi:hypothetical protein GLAREA_02486 [Glarea lozoyensis ATCC 20868]|uniref:Uncharacterized protein n=1 Tax=Glarea lozoyensis (strain ATCC 20868 / MF5171) TaxID=1116229 RepID=S3DJ47_GLAL2|nr:uncharacterized protein GLAREA_02486 [Glarea lozoyensis ATCC 20868]EPE26573.1 hypothetical protein GLAREA_02486 [Glarea lozoyensis ATCC 20868]
MGELESDMRPPAGKRSFTNVGPRKGAACLWYLIVVIFAIWLGSRAGRSKISSFVRDMSDLYVSGINYDALEYDRGTLELNEGMTYLTYELANENATKAPSVFFNGSSFQVDPRYQENAPKALPNIEQGNASGTGDGPGRSERLGAAALIPENPLYFSSKERLRDSDYDIAGVGIFFLSHSKLSTIPSVFRHIWALLRRWRKDSEDLWESGDIITLNPRNDEQKLTADGKSSLAVALPSLLVGIIGVGIAAMTLILTRKRRGDGAVELVQVNVQINHVNVVMSGV